ncbi:MAG: FKBP-type peptidyl-prolyl cis-trans isomerase FklB, partial [Bermanella sp.]
MRKLPLIAIMAATVLVGCSGEKEVALETNIDKMSYGIGLSMARSVQDQPIDINSDAMLMGLRDALAEKDPRIAEEEIREAFTAVREDEMKKQQEGSEVAMKAGEDYMAETAKKEGVTATDSGLLY